MRLFYFPSAAQIHVDSAYRSTSACFVKLCYILYRSEILCRKCIFKKKFEPVAFYLLINLLKLIIIDKNTIRSPWIGGIESILHLLNCEPNTLPPRQSNVLNFSLAIHSYLFLFVINFWKVKSQTNNIETETVMLSKSLLVIFSFLDKFTVYL